MSDLISRSESYDQLANKLTWLMGYGDDLYLAVGSDIRDVIYNTPTAYSVEKVVEELKKRSKEYNSGVRLHGKSEEMLTDDAIEIVKQGGVREDVCEWKYNDSEYCFESSCDHLHIFMYDGPKENEYDFCPYCGKKIKVVE